MDFKKGQIFEVTKESKYGKEFNETYQAEIVGVKNYKEKGQRLEMVRKDIDMHYNVWASVLESQNIKKVEIDNDNE